MKSRTKAKPWWAFFPLKGLELTNKRHDLTAPFLGDVTLIAKEHLDQIVPLLKLNVRMTKGHDHESDILYILRNMTFKEEFQSLIAVRRTGHIQPRSHHSAVSVASHKRALKFSALLTLTLLYDSSKGETCGLVEQLYRKTKTIAMIELQDGGFSLQKLGDYQRMIIDNRSNIRLSRAEMKKHLNEKRFKCLTDIILTQKKRNGIQNVALESTLKLADAVLASSPSPQLLGAITSLEILIMELGDSYEKMKRRLIGLIGLNAYDSYKAHSVLNARHRYVHKGEHIDDSKMSNRAIALALLGLLNYADASLSFSSKQKFINYLDFVNSADRISDSWTASEKKAFSKLLKHQNKNHSFAFI